MALDTMSMTSALSASTAQPPQYTDSETYSQHILGPVWFKLSNLKVEGTAGNPVFPQFVAPEQSPYIIASNEQFNASVKIRFNESPLSSLLMCLKTKITVKFSFEGVGAEAPELDLTTEITTEKGQYEYEIKLSAVPHAVGMKPGLYAIAGVVAVGPGVHECAQYIFGYGYIAKSLLQVY